MQLSQSHQTGQPFAVSMTLPIAYKWLLVQTQLIASYEGYSLGVVGMGGGDCFSNNPTPVLVRTY